MAKIYYRMIKTGRMTIDEVPIRWRASVQEMLDADKQREIISMSYTLEKTIDLAIQAAVQKAKKEAILECRPVGSYFITETEDDPNILFGGVEEADGQICFTML